MKSYIAILCMASGLTAGAQQLSTEVVVDRTVVPAERPATRLSGLTPALVLPTPGAPTLGQSFYTGLSDITRSYARLDPAYGAMAAEPSPYRGYVDLGYFPLANGGITAGYRFVDNEHLTLGASIMAGGGRYEPAHYSDGHDLMQQWGGSADVNLAWRPMTNSTLSAIAGYTFMRQETTYWEPLSLNTGRVGVNWNSRTDNLSYNIGARVDFEKSSDTYRYLTEVGNTPLLPGLAQQHWQIEAEGAGEFAKGSEAGIAIEADFVHTATYRELADVYPGPESATVGTVGVKPFYRLTINNLTARVGLKVDITAGDGRTQAHIAPDLHLQWEALPQLGVWADISGGDVTNPFSDLRQITPYQVFTHAFHRSEIPVRIEAGINLGGFNGFTAGIHGGYAKANEWLLMGNGIFTPWEALYIRGWKAGITLGYEWKWLRASASADVTPGSYDNVWLDNRDRARYVIGADIEVRPITPLTVALGYEMRACRTGYSLKGNRVDLGNINDLSLRASYAINNAVTIFANVNNLIGHRHYLIDGQLSRSQYGLVGVAIKF